MKLSNSVCRFQFCADWHCFSNHFRNQKNRFLSRNSAFDSPCLVKHAFNLQIPIQSHRSELHKPVKPLLHAGLKPIPWSDVMDEAQRQ